MLPSPWSDTLDSVICQVRKLQHEGVIRHDKAVTDRTDDLEEEERNEARTVAQQFYITYITLSTFDKTGEFENGMTREEIWDIGEIFPLLLSLGSLAYLCLALGCKQTMMSKP